MAHLFKQSVVTIDQSLCNSLRSETFISIKPLVYLEMIPTPNFSLLAPNCETDFSNMQF